MSIDRQIATGDICLFLPLAIPGVGAWLVDALLHLNQLLALPGNAQMTGLSPLLLSLLGIVGVGFAWVRLTAPDGMFSRQTMVIKGFAALLVGFAVLRGAPAVLLLISLVDGAAAVLLATGRRAHR